jgi:hypothetical protein
VDLYTKRPIVPRALTETGPAGGQFNEYTSGLAVWLGKTFPEHASPLRIDHLIKNVFGGVATDALGLADVLAGDSKLRQWEPADITILGRVMRVGGEAGTRPYSVSKLYDRLEDAYARQDSYLHQETEGERAERLMLEDAKTAIASLSVLRTAAWATDKRASMTLQMASIARAALKALESRSRALDEAMSATAKELSKQAEVVKLSLRERLRARGTVSTGASQ